MSEIYKKYALCVQLQKNYIAVIYLRNENILIEYIFKIKITNMLKKIFYY